MFSKKGRDSISIGTWDYICLSFFGGLCIRISGCVFHNKNCLKNIFSNTLSRIFFKSNTFFVEYFEVLYFWSNIFQCRIFYYSKNMFLSNPFFRLFFSRILSFLNIFRSNILSRIYFIAQYFQFEQL